MELKKCPICGFPNDKTASTCEECEHKFVEYFDEEEEREVFHREQVNYKYKKKEAEIYTKKREFNSLVHLFGFFVLNILCILGLIGADKKWGYILDNCLINVTTRNGFLGFDPTWFVLNLQTIKYITTFTLFQLIFNLLIIKHIDDDKVLIFYNVFVMMCLIVIVIAMRMLGMNR